MRLQPIVTACLLAGIGLLFYAFRLTAAPVAPEEAAFVAQAQSIRAGHTPLFVHANGELWLQPMAVYAGAAAHRIGGDDVSVRVVSAIAGALDVALVFLIAHLISGRSWVGLMAAGILLLTPAHWALAQRGSDALMPVPLILLWLWNLVLFLKFDRLRSLGAAAAALGLSIYAHPAAPLTAVFLWSLTLLVTRRRNRIRLLVSTLVFAAAWIPAAYWFFRHPETYADTFGRWFVFAAHLRNPLEAIAAFINPNTLGTRASLYWGFWDPSWLFFGARDAAPLLVATLPMILLGGYYCLRHLTRDMAILVIGAALVVPIAGATFSIPHYIAAAAGVLPILAIVSSLGANLLATLLRRRPIEDHEAAAPVEGWDSDHLMPRS